MLEQFIPPKGTRKNNLTLESVGGYIAAIIHDADRALVRRIVNGDDLDYMVSNKNMVSIIGSILDEPATDLNLQRWANALVANATLPIYRRTEKSRPTTPVETPEDNLQLRFDQELGRLMASIDNYLGDTDKVVSFSLKIKTIKKDVIKLKGKIK